MTVCEVGISGFIACFCHTLVALFSDGCRKAQIAEIWALVGMLFFPPFLGGRRVMLCFYSNLHIIKGLCFVGDFLFV